METMTKLSQEQKEQLVQEALKNAMSYKAYAALVEQHADAETNTGPDITEALINYTLLSHRRMKRWGKTFKLQQEDIDQINAFDGDMTWLIITESWCGDAAQTMPMMDKIAQASQGKIQVKVVLRDENLELMDAFLTNGARSIAKLIAIDNRSGKIIGEWGPRPSIATQMVQDYKAEHGKLTPEFKQDLQVWYNKDKGRNATEDLLELIN